MFLAILFVFGGSGRSGTWTRENNIGPGDGMVQVACTIKPERLDTLLDSAFEVVDAISVS